VLTQDNRSSLSHDFYQVLAGKTDMTLWGWKQLNLWSLDHAVLDKDEKKKLEEMWAERWGAFVTWLAETDWEQPVDKISMP
jgi:adenosine deaminase CECR1